MNIYIASDHRGVEIKNRLIDYLNKIEINVYDIGLENNQTDDYPDFAFKVCKKVLEENSIGILICGNGIGMSIAANKVKGIRAVRAVNIDDAFNGKNHNGANVLCLGADLDDELIYNIVDMFITTKTPSEEKHIKRINKIINFENGAYNEL